MLPPKAELSEPFILHIPISFLKIRIKQTADLSYKGEDQRSVFFWYSNLKSANTYRSKIIVPAQGVCISPFVHCHVPAAFSVTISAHKHDIYLRR